MWTQFSESQNKETTTMKMKEPTYTELMEAAMTQCTTAKTILAELKMLLELRKLAHKKMQSRMHEKVVRTKSKKQLTA